MESLLVNVPAEDFMPKVADGRGGAKRARVDPTEAVAALASSMGAQEVAAVAPVQQITAAFGPRWAGSSLSL